MKIANAGMVLALVLAGCSGTNTTQGKDTVVLFHTTQGIFGIQKSRLSRERMKIVVDNFYPSACTDSDADRDGVPDELDDDSDDQENEQSCDATDGGRSRTRDHGHDDSRSDAGSSSSDDDDDDGEDDDARDGGDDDDDSAHHCHVCNRGPGTSGDFRFEARDTEGRLERGRVVSRIGDTITVPAPNGVVTILVTATTQVRGDPTPGSEIRVRGTLQGPAAAMTIEASELEVLCPGPTPMQPGQLPPGTTPVTPGGSLPLDLDSGIN